MAAPPGYRGLEGSSWCASARVCTSAAPTSGPFTTLAEILDNSVDEAVAGHATRISVEMIADVRRGPTTAAESRSIRTRNSRISRRWRSSSRPCTRAASSAERTTRPRAVCTGLASRWSMRFRRASSSRSRATRCCGPSLFPAGSPPVNWRRSARRRTGAGLPCGSGRTPRFLARSWRSAPRPFSGWRGRRRTSNAGSKSAGTVTPLLVEGDRPRPRLCSTSGGWRLSARAAGRAGADRRFLFEGRADLNGSGGKAEWALAWPDDEGGGEASLSSYCNTIPTPQGGTHENGLRTGLTRALRAFGEMAGNKKAATITADDVLGGAQAVLSCFIPEPQFQGQTKERLGSPEAARLVDQALKSTLNTGWLATVRRQGRCSTASSCAWKSGCGKRQRRTRRASR